MKQTFFGRRAFLILVISVFLMPFLLKGTRLTIQSNRNDVKDWLPETFEATETHRWFTRLFPLEQFVLVSWAGRTEDDPGCTLNDEALEMLALKLEDFDPDLTYLGLPKRLRRILTEAGLTRARRIRLADHVPLDQMHLYDETDVELIETLHQADLTQIEGIEEADAKQIRAAIEDRTTPFKSPVLTGQRLVSTLRTHFPEDAWPAMTDEAILQKLQGTIIGPPDEKTSDPGNRKTCLVVTLNHKAAGKNLRKTLETIRRIAEDECGVPRDKIRMGGPPVDNVAIDVEGERTLFRLAILAAIVGIGLAYLCFRSLRLTFFVFFCGILAAGIGLSSVFWSGVVARILGFSWFADHFATCDAILLTMPSLVYVLAISGAVHIINYYHDAIAEHGLQGGVERAIKMGAVPCTLAAITTAIGLGSLAASALIPIQKFGIYSAVGVLGTLALLFLYLPANLYFYPSYDFVRGGPRANEILKGDSLVLRFWQRVGAFIIRRNMLVSITCLLVLAIFGVGLTMIKPSVKLMNMFDKNAEIVHHYAWLEKHLGPLVPLEVVLAFDNEVCGSTLYPELSLPKSELRLPAGMPEDQEISRLNFAQRLRMVRDLEASIEADETLASEVGGALSASLFAPPVTQTRSSALFRLSGNLADQELSKRLVRHRESFKDYVTTDKMAADRKATERGEDPTLAQLGVPAKQIAALRASGIETLCALKAAAGDTVEPEALAAATRLDEAAAQAVHQAVDNWRIAHGDEVWRLTVRVRALTPTDYSVFVNDIDRAVQEQLDDHYRKPVKLSYSEDSSGVASPVLDQEGQKIPDTSAPPIAGMTARCTGLVPLVYETQHELLRGLTNSLLLAFVLIAIVMICVLRSPSAGLISMVPNIFPVVLVFGYMGWSGTLVDVGTMMTASVALGVAVDDTIHYLTWFRRGLDQGLDRKGAVMQAYQRCATAMTQTTLIGGLGLSVFMFSTFTPTQRFGVLMLALLATALLGDLIFLPAVLSGPLGRFFGMKKRKETEEVEVEESAP